MATLIGKQFKSASVDDTCSQTIEYTYEIESAADVQDFINQLPRKGAARIITTVKTDAYGNQYPRQNLTYIDSYSIDKAGTLPGGRIHLTVTEQSHFAGYLKKTVVLPEDLPPYNFRMSSQVVEEVFNKYYPGKMLADYNYPMDNGVYFSGVSSDNPTPLTNTSGCWIEGTRTKTTSQISFSYNRAYVNFSGIYRNVGCVNSDYVTICGMYFPPRTIKIDQIDVEAVLETYDMGSDMINYQDSDGTIHQMKGKGTWHYYRLNITLSADPESFNVAMANASTYFLRNDLSGNTSLRKIWRWTDPWTGKAQYGTVEDYTNSQAFDGEAIGEPMFLDSTGTDLMPLDSNSRQIPSYIFGCPYRPVDFNELELPSTEPLCWELADGYKSSTNDISMSEI